MISIVIPAYNEENSISATIIRCKNVIKNYGPNAEVIIVNDGSTDNTSEKLQDLGVRIFNHPHNIGYGSSLKDGIKLSQNEIIVITDADGTYPIESIPELVDELQKGFDMVVGARKGKHYDESFKKKILRKVLKFLVEFTSGRKIEDINSGLRAFNKKTIIPYFGKLCNTFSFTTSLTLAYMMTGQFVKYIPINYEERVGKSKVKMFKDSIRTLQFIIEAILYYNPIKIFIVFSSVLLIIACVNLIIAFFTKLQVAYILGISSILLSLLNFSIGLISVQLKQLIRHDYE